MIEELYKYYLKQFIAEMKKETDKEKDIDMHPRYTIAELTEAFDLVWAKRKQLIS